MKLDDYEKELLENEDEILREAKNRLSKKDKSTSMQLGIR